jgi:hypothetical protein
MPAFHAASSFDRGCGQIFRCPQLLAVSFCRPLHRRAFPFVIGVEQASILSFRCAASRGAEYRPTVSSLNLRAIRRKLIFITPALGELCRGRLDRDRRRRNGFGIISDEIPGNPGSTAALDPQVQQRVSACAMNRSASATVALPRMLGPGRHSSSGRCLPVRRREFAEKKPNIRARRAFESVVSMP